MIHLLYTNTKAKSDVIITDPNAGVIERELLHCCHCGTMWYVQPGSGRKRGWCHKCNQPTCGCTECDTCIPLEKKLGY